MTTVHCTVDAPRIFTSDDVPAATRMSFFQAFIYLLAAVISVPIAKRLGLGSVLGYLLGGVVIGPAGLRLVGTQDGDLMHVAEFGVVMMLFLIGLELRPARLWTMRAPIFGLGSAQVILTASLIGVIAYSLGFRHRMAFAIGMILALSSTAIVLQLLNEKSLMKTAGGQASFSVLLFQDIAVLPILVILPLLATMPPIADAGHGTTSFVAQLPGWQHALVVVGAIAAVILGGRFFLRPLFRIIASTKLREMFTATALLLVLGIALLMQEVGLSPALGTFLAGVVLADSEYRHQLETDIEPFKGLLLGLFFIAVGAGIDFALVLREAQNVGLIVGGMLLVKAVVLLLLGRIFHLDWPQAALLALALAQGSEFAFVLSAFALQSGVLTADVTNVLVASVALTMAVSPLLLMLYEKFLQPRVLTVLPEREPDDIDERENPVIVAGVGRFRAHRRAFSAGERRSRDGARLRRRPGGNAPPLRREIILWRRDAARPAPQRRSGAGAFAGDHIGRSREGAEADRDRARAFSKAADPRASAEPAARLRVAAAGRERCLSRDLRQRAGTERRRAQAARCSRDAGAAVIGNLPAARRGERAGDGEDRDGRSKRLRVNGAAAHREPGERARVGSGDHRRRG
jgi:monovalent cation:proton antiporter-2 (CPA2) family protein